MQIVPAITESMIEESWAKYGDGTTLKKVFIERLMRSLLQPVDLPDRPFQPTDQPIETIEFTCFGNNHREFIVSYRLPTPYFPERPQ
jgi:hypothetical protein